MALSLTCRRLLYRQHPTFLQCRQTGYIVLLPDVPKQSDDNALLRSDSLQEFSSLTLRKCYDGVVRRALDFESGFWRLEKEIKGGESDLTEVELFQEYLCPLEELSRPLDNVSNAVKVLHQATNMMTDAKYTKIATRAVLARENKFNSPLLFNNCKKTLNKESTSLKEDQKRLLDKYVLFGKLNGLELPNNQYETLLSVRKDISKNQENYNNKLSHETRLYQYPINDPHMVKNIPEHTLKAMSDGATTSGGPWNVRYSTMRSFLEHCPDSLVRSKVWRSSVSFGLHEDATKITSEVESIRSGRRREAKILGYPSYADYSMETKMAGSVENILEMLDLLLHKARPAQAHEIESLNKFAFQNGYHKPLEFWDVPYWQRQQLTKTYNSDENDLSVYFPFETVLDGLFSLVNDVFGVQIREKSGVDTWHKDVRFFEVFESNSSSPVAYFYLDPYKRSGKSYTPGAALTLRNRSLVGSGQIPQIGFVFNFPPPIVGKTSLLSFRNVLDLFGRFGYALQVLLTKSSYSDVAGTSFMEVDAVEIPSHLMVHWAFTQPVIERISGHYETGEKLPSSALNSLDRVRRHMAGFHLCNEIYRCRLDLEIFSTEIHWDELMKKLWPMHSAFPLDSEDNHPLSFYQIYNRSSAAYYADLWSKVIAADIFTAFQEVGIENGEEMKAVGKRFRDTYLGGVGGAAEKFRKFRGRDPSPDAFLLWLGLQKPLKSPSPK